MCGELPRPHIAGLGPPRERQFLFHVAERVRHATCFVEGMSLPYPYEFETGALKTRVPAPRTPVDVAAHVDDAIRVQGSALELFGVPMDVAAPDSVRTVATQLRRAVTQHFQERVSAPDEDTWELFASQAHDQLEGRRTVDALTLRVLRATIDSL